MVCRLVLIFFLDTSNSISDNNNGLIINVPDLETPAVVTHSSVAKAKDYGLIASDRLLPGR